MLIVVVSLAMAGCALFMTPEEREARRHQREAARATAMSPVNLCYKAAFEDGLPPEYLRAIVDRNIRCDSPQMQELLAAKRQAEAVQRASDQSHYQDMQNLGTAILQQNQPQKPTRCTWVGNVMTCY